MGRVGRRGFGRLLRFGRGPFRRLSFVAPGGVRGVLGEVQSGDPQRRTIGGLRVGPILLGVEEARKAQNDVKLLGGQVCALRILD